MTLLYQGKRWCHYCGKFTGRHRTNTHFSDRAKRNAGNVEWRARNRSYMAEYGKKWRKENPDKARGGLYRWRKRISKTLHPSYFKMLNRFKEFHAKTKRQCSDTYIRRLLVNKHKITNPTNEQIEQHRARIQALRSKRFFRTLAGVAALKQ